MKRCKGPTYHSFSEVLTRLFYKDCSVSDVCQETGLDRKTVFSVLRILRKEGFVQRIPTGVRNNVKFHLPRENSRKAMACYGWKKERWLKKYVKNVQEWQNKLADMNAVVMKFFKETPEIQKLLSPKAKKYIFTLLNSHFSPLDRIKAIKILEEGTLCIECLNNGLDLTLTVYDDNTQVYVCQKCGVEQEIKPFYSTR